MDQAFSSGFFAAFAALYAAALCYCVWAARRRRADQGTGVLCAFFGLLFLDCASTALLALGLSAAAERGIHVLETTLDSFVPFTAAAFLIAHEQTSTARLRLLLLVGAALSIAAGVEASTLGTAPGQPAGPVGVAAAGAGAALTITATYFVGKAFTRRRTFGVVPFLGACAMSVALAHDAAASVVGGARLGGFGHAAFALSLFAGAFLEFTVRRDRLMDKTKELAVESEKLSRSFKSLRAAQSELVRKEQLAAIGELSAIVAHEVRNPLAVITNAVATLRRPATTGGDRDVLLGILSEETARLNQLVGDLLHYAKPLSLERDNVSVREIVEKALGVLATRVDVTVEIVEASPVCRVRADALLLRQAFDNVVNNAVQAMPGGGTLLVELSSAPDEAGVELVFRDNGEGMNTVVRSRALDAFFTTRPAGTGLGLAIVARVVDAHGGRLRILSEPDTGTEVRIFLPEDPEAASSSGRGRILPPIIERFSSTVPPPTASRSR